MALAPEFLRCWRNRDIPTDNIPKVVWDATPHLSATTRDQCTPGSPEPRPRARLPTADNHARGLAARARLRPRDPAIKTFRLRASSPPAAPLPPLPAVSSHRAPPPQLARRGPGPESPITVLEFHLRNRDQGDSSGSVSSAGLGPTQSARPGDCHSLSTAGSLTNEHGVGGDTTACSQLRGRD